MEIGLYAHEMGHALGWPHSSGRYGLEYDSKWDVMSSGYGRLDEKYGWMPLHTISSNKDFAGWIPANRKWVRSGAEGVETREIVRSALPPETGDLMAEIRVSADRFYTIEARMNKGFDQPIHVPAVIIHMVEGRRAYLIDPDNNGNASDAGSAWRPGEVFVDSANNFHVHIVSVTPNGFRVAIQRGNAPVVIASDSVLNPAEMGATYDDTLYAVGGGLGMTGVQWTITFGGLPPGIFMDTDGRINGVPLQLGVFRFTARASFGSSVDQREFRLTVREPLTVANDSVRPPTIMGRPFVDSLSARGGSEAYTWQIPNGRLPIGLNLNSATGIISGSAQQEGTFWVTVRVMSDGAWATKQLVYRVYATMSFVSAPQRPGAVMGVAYNDTLRAAGGLGAPLWELTGGALPPGIQIDPRSGTLSGMPERKGSYQFTLRASDALVSAEQTFTIQVGQPVIAAGEVMNHLFVGGKLSASEIKFLDLIGNRNGSFDIGDVRAWLIDNGQLPAGAATANAVVSTLKRLESEHRK
jgi:hypothetical protein